MTSTKKLHHQINEVRLALNLPERAMRTSDTVISLEKELAVYSAQRVVFEEWSKKLDDAAYRNEILFYLQLLSLIPLPVWTSRKDRTIAFWNKYAEMAYGYKENTVLGEDFIQLLVNEAERAQADQDLEDITEGREGLQHFNMAHDKDSDGMTIKVLTCCFAVFDPRHNEVTQAEVSFDVSRLEEFQAELDEIQDKWEKTQKRKAELLEKEREYALTSLMSYQEKFCNRCDEQRQLCDDELSNPNLPAAQRNLHETASRGWVERKSSFMSWFTEIKYRLEDCETREEMQEIRVEIDVKKEDNV